MNELNELETVHTVRDYIRAYGRNVIIDKETCWCFECDGIDTIRGAFKKQLGKRVRVL